MFKISTLSRSGAFFFSDGNWASTSVDSKQKLFKLHHFLFLSGGRNFNIEIQESPTGQFTGHADNTVDPHDAVPASHGKTVQECLENLIGEINKRSG